MPKFRQYLKELYAADKGPKTLEELERSLTYPAGRPEEDDEWDVEYEEYGATPEDVTNIDPDDEDVYGPEKPLPSQPNPQPAGWGSSTSTGLLSCRGATHRPVVML